MRECDIALTMDVRRSQCATDESFVRFVNTREPYGAYLGGKRSVAVLLSHLVLQDTTYNCSLDMYGKVIKKECLQRKPSKLWLLKAWKDFCGHVWALFAGQTLTAKAGRKKLKTGRKWS